MPCNHDLGDLLFRRDGDLLARRDGVTFDGVVFDGVVFLADTGSFDAVRGMRSGRVYGSKTSTFLTRTSSRVGTSTYAE